MAINKDDSSKKEKNSESHFKDKKFSSSEVDKKKNKIPKFEEKDMYRIKYDF